MCLSILVSFVLPPGFGVGIGLFLGWLGGFWGMLISAGLSGGWVGGCSSEVTGFCKFFFLTNFGLVVWEPSLVAIVELN